MVAGGRLAAGDRGVGSRRPRLCGGYQMLGTRIWTASSRRSRASTAWAGCRSTRSAADKVTRRVRGPDVDGYLIHHGRVSTAGRAWVRLDEGAEGCVSPDGRIRGTVVHGLFEHDGFRRRFLIELAARRGKCFVPAGVSFAPPRPPI